MTTGTSSGGGAHRHGTESPEQTQTTPPPADTPTDVLSADRPGLTHASARGVETADRVRIIDGVMAAAVAEQLLPDPDAAAPDSAAPVAAADDEDRVASTAPMPGVVPPATDPGRFSPRNIADEDTVGFAFNLAKIAGHGEDSDPLQLSAAHLVVVGVLDGMGGAGGTTYSTSDGPHTGAYLASRTAREAAARRLADIADHPWGVDADQLAQELASSIGVALTTQLAGLDAPPSGLRSKMIRALPTTLALAVAQRDAAGSSGWTCHLFWAGDSRVYVVEPRSGAAQLTVDDIRDQGDAMANLREDSILSNAVSADTPFVINTRTVALCEPFLLVAATDGCFGYLPSPMHFEHLLLSTLRDAATADAWSCRVPEAVTAVTGDDAAMTVIGRGASFKQLQETFAERTNTLDNTWIRPLNRLASEKTRLQLELDLVTRRHRDSEYELWADYKPDYERFLTTPSTAKDDQ